jgi:predicted deacylase
MKSEPIVATISSQNPGPTVVVMAGVHGDEPVGVRALERLLPGLELTCGTLIAVVANPAALEAGVRFIDTNLNRSLIPNVPVDTNEGRLAQILMGVLDKADALLDIHAGMGGEPPFVICEESSFAIAKRMPVSIVSTGWVEAEPGSTDEYMYRQGKPALCIECGDKRSSEEMTPLAVEAIRQFLGFYGMLEQAEPLVCEQRTVKVEYPVFKKSDQFAFARGFTGFEALRPGELIAIDGNESYFAPDYASCIIFPWSEAPVGAEAFLIARA